MPTPSSLQLSKGCVRTPWGWARECPHSLRGPWKTSTFPPPPTWECPQHINQSTLTLIPGRWLVQFCPATEGHTFACQMTWWLEMPLSGSWPWGRWPTDV